MKTKNKKSGFTPTPICIVGEKEECVQNQSGRQIVKSTASRKLVKGFTIVELLTVMAIIAILMGLLVPAMQQVRKLAKDTSQRAQFHSIDVALEAYCVENGEGVYPGSEKSVGTTFDTVGAHKLAEALVGRDLLGLDGHSTWDAEADEAKKDVYPSVLPPKSTTATDPNFNRKRLGPYLNAENVEAFQINQLFDTYTIGSDSVYPGDLTNTGTRSTTRSPTPVLTDVYRVKRVTMPNGKTVMAGTPILYYKADTSANFFPPLSDTTIDNTDANNSIYDCQDNESLIQLYQMMKPQTGNENRHRFALDYTDPATSKTGRRIFYDILTDPKFTSQTRPYNMSSYILMSAGADGIYGTKDDIYNFQPQ